MLHTRGQDPQGPPYGRWPQLDSRLRSPADGTIDRTTLRGGRAAHPTWIDHSEVDGRAMSMSFKAVHMPDHFARVRWYLPLEVRPCCQAPGADVFHMLPSGRLLQLTRTLPCTDPSCVACAMESDEALEDALGNPTPAGIGPWRFR